LTADELEAVRRLSTSDLADPEPDEDSVPVAWAGCLLNALATADEFGAGVSATLPLWLFNIICAVPFPICPRRLRVPVRWTAASGIVERTVPSAELIAMRASSFEGIRYAMFPLVVSTMTLDNTPPISTGHEPPVT